MTNKQLKDICEAMGFGVVHVRRRPRSEELRAYMAYTPDLYPNVHEIRWSPERPEVLWGYEHATKPNGWTQYDKLVRTWVLSKHPELEAKKA